jgi:hypothetical protein
MGLTVIVGVSAALTGALGGCRTTEEGLSASVPDAGGPPVSMPPPALPAARPPTADGGIGPEVPAPAACSAGQVVCSGRIPQTCGADGRWVNGPACDYACQGGCVNRFSAVSSGRGSPTNEDGLAEFSRNDQTFFSARGGLLGARGFNVAVMDAASGTPVDDVKNFDPWTSPLSGSALNDLADYLEAIEPGRLVLIAACDDAGINRIGSCDKHDTAPVQRLLTTLRRLGSTQIDAYCYRGAWSLVTIIGQGQALSEKLSPGARITAEVMLPALP